VSASVSGLPLLQTGDEIKCRRCGRWHVLVQVTAGDDRPCADKMLYVRWREGLQFAGSI
jgi:hypothetical protein